MPRLSVILPVHDCERHVGEAVDSILRQTFRDFELIVVDDGSTDRTPEIVRSRREARLVLARREENRGLVDALNWGLSLATGPVVARMDADDVSHPRRLELQLAHLDAHPEVGLVGTRFSMIDPAGRMVHGPLSPRRRDMSRPLTDGAIRHRMMFYPAVCHAAAMFRRDVIDACGGGYRGSNGFPEDYELFLRMLKVTRLANLPGVLLMVRVNPDGLQATRREQLHRAHAKLSAEAVRHFVGRVDASLPIALDGLFLHRALPAGTDMADAYRAYLAITEAFLRAVPVDAPSRREIRRYSALKALTLACRAPASAMRLARALRMPAEPGVRPAA